MFSEGGADTGLESIAKEAGVGIGTLYRHFPTRDTLIEEVYRTETQNLAQAAPRLVETLPPVEALRAWLRLFVDHIATKQVMSPVLPRWWAEPLSFTPSPAQVKAAIGLLVDLAVASGASASISNRSTCSAPGRRRRHQLGSGLGGRSAERLVDILIAGVRIPTAD